MPLSAPLAPLVSKVGAACLEGLLLGLAGVLRNRDLPHLAGLGGEHDGAEDVGVGVAALLGRGVPGEVRLERDLLAGLEELVPAAHLRDAGLDHLRDVGAVDHHDGRGRFGRQGRPGQGRRAGDRRRPGLDERTTFDVACCFALHGFLPFDWLTRTLYHKFVIRGS